LGEKGNEVTTKKKLNGTELAHLRNKREGRKEKEKEYITPLALHLNHAPRGSTNGPVCM
jgi:hypothetical protein